MKARRLGVALGLLAAQAGCGEPNDYGEAVDCVAWFKATSATQSRRYRGLYPGWAVLHARKIGAKMGKTQRQVDAELTAAVSKAEQAQSRLTFRQLRKDIETPGSTANRCWFTYN